MDEISIRELPPYTLLRKGEQKMSIYGYIRVSSRDQNEDRQLIALRGAGVEERFLYMDKVSGKDFDRPEYRKLVKKLKPGDLLMIQSNSGTK